MALSSWEKSKRQRKIRQHTQTWQQVCAYSTLDWNLFHLFLAIKTAQTANSFPFFFIVLPQSVCQNKQLFKGRRFGKQPLKQAFPLPMLNTALHSCPQKLVSTAEKKCLIERHKPSALKMGSAQSIWNWIKKKKKSFQKYLRETVSFSLSLFYKCQSRAFLFLFILLAHLSLIKSFHHLNGCYFPCYLSTFSSFYPPNFSYFISTESLHFQMSLRFLRTAHTLKCACQPPALGGGRGDGFPSPLLPASPQMQTVVGESFLISFFLFFGHCSRAIYNCLVNAPSLWHWGYGHFCSQMVREKSQATEGLELLFLT